ncbi:MAG: FAD-binding oxidoreductase, partial [Rhodospirillales bacterium]|nr:FAD-binding oxidoreductase [Rhodospirillales bacterium]
EALRQWNGMDARVGASTGFRAGGIAYLCDDEAAIAQREAWLEHSRPFQLDTRIISSAEVARMMPGTGRKYAGALYTASDGQAEPQKAAPAIALAARRAGASVFTNCAVRGIETEGGRVAAAVTERGRIRCQTVVLAGGAWSRLFLGSVGIDMPQLKMLSSVMRTAPLPGGDVAPEIAALGHGFAMRQRDDGGFTLTHGRFGFHDLVPDSFRLFFDFLPAWRMERKDVHVRFGKRFFEEARLPSRWALDRPSPFEHRRILDPEPYQPILDAASRNLERELPAVARLKVVQRWAGLIDVTPDAVPVISHVDTLPGLVISTGYSGHGFGIGPGAGRLTADLVMGTPPVVDPTPFRLARFAERPRPKPHGAV